MSAPAKAELAAINGSGTVVDTIPVQFNPASMRVQMSNSVDGGASRGRQTQQYNGSASTTLTLDLQFDTADEGSSSEPVDVRTHTDRVRQFVLPGGTESKQAPPRARFRWGTFELTGVMDSLTEELSFFSSDGVPLRSKLSISIKEQDSRFAALERGSGANDDTNPPGAGELSSGAGPGTSGFGIVGQASVALSGETAADFVARAGLAPEAWRGLGGALATLEGGIELEAGATIGFSADLSVGAGLGVTTGFEAGLDLSVGASLGLGAAVSASVDLEAGFALSAAGGLTAAVDRAASTEASAAASSARTSFAAPPAPPAPRPASARPVGPAPAQSPRSPLAQIDQASAPGRLTTAAPAPRTPPPDARATSYGRGVPLRDRVVATPEPSVAAARRSTTATTAMPAGHPPAPWEQTSASKDTDREQHRRRPSCGCHRCDPMGRHR